MWVTVTCSAGEDTKKIDFGCVTYELSSLTAEITEGLMRTQRMWVVQKKQYLSTCGVAIEGSQGFPW
jgi:hypothetical protein